jgi:CRP/FNR family transcriptional regulator
MFGGVHLRVLERFVHDQDGPKFLIQQEGKMATSTPVIESGLEDALALLPISGTTVYSQGQTIYGPRVPPNGIYLVVAGKVALSRVAQNGDEVILEIVGAEELFGESAALGVPNGSERAATIERTTLMSWPISEIEGLLTKHPRLAVALLQIFARRNADLGLRIEGLAIDGIPRRLARSLLRLSERFGTPERDGSVRIMPFTHEFLSRYVGTSREVITQHMNRLRRLGCVNYSRDGIFLHRDALMASVS